MTPTEYAASAAWAAMVADQPMHPGVALDMVQDECGEREDALRALIVEASVWCDSFKPPLPKGAKADHPYYRADGLTGTLFTKDWSAAKSHIGHPLYGSAEWKPWREATRKAVELCRELEAAAGVPA